MEEEIQELLEEKYQNIKIEVGYKDIRIYEIIVQIEHAGIIYESKFIYKYDGNITLKSNVSKIINIIDYQIIIPFYKKGE